MFPLCFGHLVVFFHIVLAIPLLFLRHITVFMLCERWTSGEIFELKSELNSDKKEKKKEAVKKVIASMTVGKDVR